MDKTTLLDIIHTENANLESLVASLSETQLCAPTLEGQRSIKDILAHVAAWERFCAAWLEDFLNGKASSTSEEDDDTVNERVFLENRNRPVHEVQADFHQAYQDLLQHVQYLTQALSEDDLNNPHRFDGMVPWNGHSFIEVIAGNSYGHYHEHAQQIRRWLEAPTA